DIGGGVVTACVVIQRVKAGSRVPRTRVGKQGPIAHCSVLSIRNDYSEAGWTLGASWPRGALWSLLSLRASRPWIALSTLWALRAGWPRGALQPLWSLRPCRSLIPLWPLSALRSLRARRPEIALWTLWSRRETADVGSANLAGCGINQHRLDRG